jgi:hypothetical protein
LDRAAFPDERRWQFADSVTITSGRHTLKFGGDFNHVSDLKDNLFRNAGEYSYSNLGAFLQDLFDPAGKRYSSFAQGFGLTQIKFATKDYNFFVQDDIRLTPELTLNFGMRYEYQQLPEPQLPNPLVPRSAVFPSDTNNFGPRIGFALSFGDKRENVVRAGYGIYYGRFTNSAISNAITNTGVAAGERQFFSSPNANTPTYPNVFATLPTIGGVSDIIVFQDGAQNPLIHQMDVIFERELGRNTVVSVSGLMSLGRYLPNFVDTNLNPPNSSTTFTYNGGILAGQTITVPKFTGPRPDTRFGRITEIRSIVSSEYYGLVLALNRRLTRGLQFQTSYTYSSAVDYGQNSTTFTSANAVLNPYDLNLERGTSNFDVPHRFVASAVYAPDSIFGLGKQSGFGRAVFGGWSIAPVVTLQSGFTYTATFGSDNVSGGTSTGVLGAGGTNRLPNLEPNAFRSPTLFNVDLRISKRFRFSETMNLEFLAEGFNIFNRVNVTNINNRAYRISGTNLNADPLFGTPSGAGNSIFRERQIQLATRFQF